MISGTALLPKPLTTFYGAGYQPQRILVKPKVRTEKEEYLSRIFIFPWYKKCSKKVYGLIWVGKFLVCHRDKERADQYDWYGSWKVVNLDYYEFQINKGTHQSFDF